jgi:cytochrome subunit of sulfide dehydrogenase
LLDPMIRPLLSVALAFAMGLTWAARAQDSGSMSGRNLAAACANCHGTNGLSQPGLPSLAARERSYLVQQMQDFKTGRRPATLMHQIAKGYTDGQIEAIAAYLSAQKAR